MKTSVVQDQEYAIEFESIIRDFHGHPDYIAITLDELRLHSAKNADYARVGNPLGNFYRVSAALKAQGINLSPAQVALVFAQKQQDVAMQMLAHDYEGNVEGIDDRLRDVHNYYKIARILVKEERYGRQGDAEKSEAMAALETVPPSLR